jgi:hypothetical protein
MRPPAESHWPQPGDLWSLWHMLRMYASAFANLVDRLGDFRLADGRQETVTAAKKRLTLGQKGVGLPLHEVFGAHASVVPEWAKTVPFKSALAQLRHIEHREELGDLKEAQLFDEIEQFNRRFREDLEGMKFYYVRPELEAYYEDDAPFGADVLKAFPQAADDISEAGKCLALGRNKGAVCHLMLAMEHALRALAIKIDASVQDKDGKWLPWLKIANNLEPKIRALPEGSEKVAWWGLSMLSSVGRAWRNPSMHPAESYNEPQARKVFEAVKGFMQDLAALL